MWVFAYGSLMWDSWQLSRGCGRQTVAQLVGYRRALNKLSVKNWGTKDHPCPTLNLIAEEGASCLGIAFQFPEAARDELLRYLRKREGRDFSLQVVAIQLVGGSSVDALVPIYVGPNALAAGTPIEQTASLVARGAGRQGTCAEYIERVAAKLAELGINDVYIARLLEVVSRSGTDDLA
jgi:cation transport protein ChaC